MKIVSCATSGVNSYIIHAPVSLGTGKKSNRWSVKTIRLALAIYCRSPYIALKDTSLVQLPSQSMLQAYTGAFQDAFIIWTHPCIQLPYYSTIRPLQLAS